MIECACCAASPAISPDTLSLALTFEVFVPLQEAADVPESMFGGEELRLLANEMVRTMRAAPGVGLAGPQIGKGLKVRIVILFP